VPPSPFSSLFLVSCWNRRVLDGSEFVREPGIQNAANTDDIAKRVNFMVC